MKHILILFIFLFSYSLIANDKNIEDGITYTKAEIKEMAAIVNKANRLKQDVISNSEKLYDECKKECSMNWHYFVADAIKKRKYKKEIAKQKIITGKQHKKSLDEFKKYEGLVLKYLKVKKATGQEKSAVLKSLRKMKENINKNKFSYRPDIYDVRAFKTFGIFFKERHNNHIFYKNPKKKAEIKKAIEENKARKEKRARNRLR